MATRYFKETYELTPLESGVFKIYAQVSTGAVGFVVKMFIGAELVGTRTGFATAEAAYVVGAAFINAMAAKITEDGGVMIEVIIDDL